MKVSKKENPTAILETIGNTGNNKRSVFARVYQLSKNRPRITSIVALCSVVFFAASAFGIYMLFNNNQDIIQANDEKSDSNKKDTKTLQKSPNDKSEQAVKSEKEAQKQNKSNATSGKKMPGATSGTSSGTSSGTNSHGGENSSYSGQAIVLLDPNDSAATVTNYVNKSSVDGAAYRSLWRDLEPTAGNYNWSLLDATLNAIQSTGKKATIHIGASGGSHPNWLAGMGVQMYTYTTPLGSGTDPVPWDNTYIQRYTQFMTALGQHINSSGKSGVVQAVSIGAPVSEMTIFGCANGQLTGGIPYSRAGYMSAWTTTITSVASAFPSKKLLVSLPLSFICANDGNDGKAFATQLFNSVKASAPVSYFAADLNADGSTRTAQADASLKGSQGINYQTIWSYTNDPSNRMQGSLSAAVCYGWNKGGRYFELYKSDIDSTIAGVVQAIGQARNGSGC